VLIECNYSYSYNCVIELLQVKMSTLKPVVSQDSINKPSNGSSTSDSVGSVEKSEESEALLLMRENFPPYVVDSFVAAGFDTLKVLSEMELDDLNDVEQHITNKFKGDSRFKTGFTFSGNFKLLLGHRKWIINFIGIVQQEITKKKLMKKSKQSASSFPHKKGRSIIKHMFQKQMSSNQINQVWLLLGQLGMPGKISLL